MNDPVYVTAERNETPVNFLNLYVREKEIGTG